MENQSLLKKNSDKDGDKYCSELMKKYRKKLAFSNYADSILYFIFYIFAIVPFWFFIMLPIALVTSIIEYIFKLLVRDHNKKSNKEKYNSTFELSKPNEQNTKNILFLTLKCY